ncbi:unnamed protein product [Notodromas monacha]|uniref:Cation/H+ exchanger transmembrane domain-containing protein n=1 Tax=Notodromas monacha TaxID=399045 RepID=A0A7R9BHP2_9CRUS|nr:unnamed protein product [Notodromas monacha]CAG0914641.1 unnamed protein product [Notodromas monacha]
MEVWPKALQSPKDADDDDGARKGGNHSEYLKKKFRKMCCPPAHRTAEVFTAILVIGLLWCGLHAITYSSKYMLPGGPGFALFALFKFCLVGGSLVELLNLPGLLGMLLVGIMLKNLPGVTTAQELDPVLSSKLRLTALLVLLTRAGLGLDADALKRLSLVVLRLVSIPCAVEAIVIAVTSRFFMNLPWGYSFMLGFVIAAVTPAVVLPCMLSVQERGLGVDEGIPTLVIASSSVEDVLVISAFGVLYGITYSEGGLLRQVVQGPCEALVGAVWGVIFGVVLWFIPAKDSSCVVMLRCLLLVLAGCAALFGGPVIGAEGFGTFAALVCAFVAGCGWKEDWIKLGHDPVSKFFSEVWYVFQPLLFGLIGTEVDMKQMDWGTINTGLAVIACGLVCRFFTTFLVVKGVGLNTRERAFIAIAWLPKATVQAALAPVVLDHGKYHNLSPETIHHGSEILTVAVLSILLTAPLGAAAIMLSAPKLLKSNQGEPDVVFDPDPPVNEGQRRTAV